MGESSRAYVATALEGREGARLGAERSGGCLGLPMRRLSLGAAGSHLRRAAGPVTVRAPLRRAGTGLGPGSDFRSVLAPSGGRPRIICLTSNDYCPDPRSLVARTPVLTDWSI